MCCHIYYNVMCIRPDGVDSNTVMCCLINKNYDSFIVINCQRMTQFMSLSNQTSPLIHCCTHSCCWPPLISASAFVICWLLQRNMFQKQMAAHIRLSGSSRSNQALMLCSVEASL